MMIDNNDIDSLLFDMDGTLWDATGSYAAVWNRCFADCGIDICLTGADLVPYMGKPIEVIVEGITSGRVPAAFSRDAFVAALGEAEEEMMPQLGGTLYPGVYRGLEELSRHYRLFMISNCGRNGLRNFMQFTHTGHLFTDSVTYGERPVPKGVNMRYLIEKYRLAGRCMWVTRRAIVTRLTERAYLLHICNMGLARAWTMTWPLAALPTSLSIF